MPRAKKKTRSATGGIHYEPERKKYKVTYKGKYVGRYSTKAEAEEALLKHIHSPEFEPDKSTFEDVYNAWYQEHLNEEAKKKSKTNDEIEASNAFRGHRASFNAFESLHKRQFCTLKIKELETTIKKKNPPTQKKMKALIRFLIKHALNEEIIEGSKYYELGALKIDSQIKSEKHYPFSQEEIDKLWDSADDDVYLQLILMCIYCGCRYGEIVKVKKSDVQLDKNCFWIQKGKTASARRAVPIHKKTKRFFESWMKRNKSEYLITRLDGKPMRFSSNYTDFLESYWIPKLKEIGIYEYTRENGDSAVHLPHDVRVTFSTRWADQKLDQTLRQKIQGHSSGDVGIDTYTKPFIESLVEEANKLK